MTPILPEWNVIIAGSWNLAILSPDWVAKNLFNTNEMNVDLMVDGFRPQIRFSHDKATLVPDAARITVMCTEPSDQSLERVERTCLNLLEALPVTPLTAVGVNVGYVDENPSAELINIFNFKDNIKYAGNEFDISASEVVRSIPLSGCVLNLRVRQETNGTVSFHFKFHTDVGASEAAKSALKSIVIARKSTALDILKKVYDLSGGGES